MPQISLEYTANIKQDIDTQDLFGSIHQVLADIGKIAVEKCKSRAVKHENYLIADGDPFGAFVHLEVKFLEGRSTELKQEIGRRLLKILTEYFEETSEELNAQITLEILDISRDLYFKYPSNL